MSKGKLIVIDGSDGSGKKTQTDLLIKFLKSNHHKISYFDFPQYETNLFGKLVGRYLNGEFGKADEVSPYLTSLLYAGDRWQASEKIKLELAKSKIVIANRYTQSNMGFQTAKIKSNAEKNKYLQWLEDLEYGVYKLPRPDLVIYLYMPHKISQALVDKKSSRKYTKLKRDIHEIDSDFLARVEKQYILLSEKYPEWRVINCMDKDRLMSPEEISAKVCGAVEEIIK